MVCRPARRFEAFAAEEGQDLVRVVAQALLEPLVPVMREAHGEDRLQPAVETASGDVHLEYEDLPSKRRRAAAKLPQPDPNAPRNLAHELLPPPLDR